MEKNIKYPKPSLTTEIPNFSNVKLEVHEKPVGEMVTISNGTLTYTNRSALKDTIKDMRDNHLPVVKNDLKIK